MSGKADRQAKAMVSVKAVRKHRSHRRFQPKSTKLVKGLKFHPYTGAMRHSAGRGGSVPEPTDIDIEKLIQMATDKSNSPTYARSIEVRRSAMQRILEEARKRMSEADAPHEIHIKI